MEVKYIVKSFETGGKFVGYLSYFNPLGRKDFSLDTNEVILFDNENDCVVSHKQTWELGRGGGFGYYEIEKVIVFDAQAVKTDKVSNLISMYNNLTLVEKEQFKKMII